MINLGGGRYIPRWQPAIAERHHRSRPNEGELIVWARKLARVVRIREIPTVDWKPEHREAYEQATHWYEAKGKVRPSMEEWTLRPYSLIIRMGNGPAPVNDADSTTSYTIFPSNSYFEWHILPEHYAVCATCGELAPCMEYEKSEMIREAAKKALEKMERDASVMPGCCWSCMEVITSRQKTMTFEGDNADVPGGPSVIFHLRAKCRRDARDYEDRWVKLEKGRVKRLSCTGEVVYHVDGMECTEEPLCPGEDAYHSGGMLNHRNYPDEVCLRCKDARAAMGLPEPPRHRR